MLLKKISALALAAVALSACSATGSETHDHGHHGHDHDKMSVEHHHEGAMHTFKCENGLMPTIQMGEDNLILQLGEEKTKLTHVPAASGELFAEQQGLNGKNTQWHQKGNEAYFEFTNSEDQLVQTTCRH